MSWFLSHNAHPTDTQLAPDVRQHGISLAFYKLKPTQVLYSAALSACAKGEQWSLGLQLLETLHAERARADTAVYNGAISMCAKAQQWQHSLALFDGLNSESLEPDLITHNSLITAFEKGGQWQRALAAFTKTPSPSVVTYSSAVSACARGSQWQVALLLFEAQKRSTGVDVILCSAVLTACRGDAWPRALQLLADFERSSRANLVAYSAAVSACAPGGHWTQALQLLVQAQARAVALPSKSFPLTWIPAEGSIQSRADSVGISRNYASEPRCSGRCDQSRHGNLHLAHRGLRGSGGLATGLLLLAAAALLHAAGALYFPAHLPLLH